GWRGAGRRDRAGGSGAAGGPGPRNRQRPGRATATRGEPSRRGGGTDWLWRRWPCAPPFPTTCGDHCFFLPPIWGGCTRAGSYTMRICDTWGWFSVRASISTSLSFPLFLGGAAAGASFFLTRLTCTYCSVWISLNSAL